MATAFRINTPAPVSSLTLHDAQLIVGSDDGTARFYIISTGSKVVKAIRGLGDEVSAVVCTAKEPTAAWVACGRNVLAFPLETTDKMVLSSTDALFELELGSDEDDVLNELAISSGDKHLAFSLDSGTVGVVSDLQGSRKVTRMKTSHTSICGTVKFVPDRYELVSGGYDSALFHFDFQQGNVLSRYDMTAPSTSDSGISLSPPFILSTAMSSTGIIAAGTADGRIWFGSVGEKRPSGKAAGKKRSRKWEGLTEQGLQVKVAEGPVVAVSFIDASTLVSCTLLGTVTAHALSRGTQDQLIVSTKWTREGGEGIAKVNAMVVNEEWVAVGGFKDDGKGVVHVWPIPESA